MGAQAPIVKSKTADSQATIPEGRARAAAAASADSQATITESAAYRARRAAAAVAPASAPAAPRCSRLLGSGANGSVYKVCDDAACTQNCVVQKKGAGVDAVEVALARSAYDLVKDSYYALHVLQFVSAISNPALPNTYILTSRYQPNAGTLQDAQRVGALGVAQLTASLVQIFATLDYMYTRRGSGFLHMDLKPANILMVPWPRGPSGAADAPEFLEIASLRRVIRVPPVVFWAVLIDYGNAYERKSGAGRTDIYGAPPFGEACYAPAFDIFRLLAALYLNFTQLNLPAQTLFTAVAAWCFGGWSSFQTLMTPRFMLKQYTMLNGEGCRVVARLIREGVCPLRTYASILEAPSFAALWV